MKFDEIFEEIKLEESSNYPFFLAVKDYRKCFNPINFFGRRQYMDRAFVTTAGGYTAIPTDDPLAPDREPIPGLENDECKDIFYFTTPVLKSCSEPLPDYSYWIPKKETFRSCNFLAYAAKTINQAVKLGRKSVEFKDPTRCKDSKTTQDFIKAVKAFWDFSTETNDVNKLSDLLKELGNIAEKLRLKKNDETFYRSKFYYDTGYPSDDNRGISHLEGFLPFEQDYWAASLELMKNAAEFEWNKEFAYCDFAGRMQHIAELNDIFANKINCLFYVKWKEIFDWYCEYMQPVVLTMKQKGVQNTAEVQKLFDVCNYDCTKQPPQYKYFDFHSKQLLKCKDPKYFPQDAINKNVSDKNGEFQILFQNIYYFRQDKPINWEKMIEFNSLSIAKSMRLFGEFSFMVLYYYGQIPAYCQNIDGSKKEYLKKAHKIFDTFVCARGFFELRALYSQDLQQCLDNIYDLLKNEVGDTMHNASLWDDAVLAGHLNRVQKICDYLKSVLPPLPNTKNKS